MSKWHFQNIIRASSYRAEPAPTLERFNYKAVVKRASGYASERKHIPRGNFEIFAVYVIATSVLPNGGQPSIEAPRASEAKRNEQANARGTSAGA